MKRLKQTKGITLVALVITIIVLLILAGISIQAITNQGLFAQARKSKEKWEEAKQNELSTLNDYKIVLNQYIGLPSTSETSPYLPDSESQILETDLNAGVVVKDGNENEWTWIVVPKSITASATKDAEIESALITYAGEYRKGSSSQNLSWVDEWYEGCGLSESDYATYYSKMLNSIKTNGGFWIGRYEAGIAGTNTDTTTASIEAVRYSHSDITSSSTSAVSQPNRIPYNFVNCSEAQSLASGMNPNTTNLKSSLMFGIQWDLVCKYLEVNSEKDGLMKTDINSNSSTKNWANYYNTSITLKVGSRYCTEPNSSTGKWSLYNVSNNFITTINGIYKTNSDKNYYGLLTTGMSEDTNKMNIYDFAGNVWEWTLEHASLDTNTPCALRGGNFNLNGSQYPASYRKNYSTFYTNFNLGFRTTLY